MALSVIDGKLLSFLHEQKMTKKGVEIIVETTIERVEKTDTGLELRLSDGARVEGDLLLAATGRKPNTENLGLDAAGVDLDGKGAVVVDERFQSSVPSIHALGDVIDTPQLAHVGFAEGMVAISDILGEDPTPVDHDRVPWGIYCQPEVAFAGMSEQAAREAGIDVAVAKHRFAASGRAMIIGETEGLVKVIAEKRPDGTAGTILGVHMVGPWVTEQLGQGYLAVNWEATVDDVAHFIQPHPTLSEVFGETVLALTGRSLH